MHVLCAVRVEFASTFLIKSLVVFADARAVRRQTKIPMPVRTNANDGLKRPANPRPRSAKARQSAMLTVHHVDLVNRDRNGEFKR